MLATCCVEKYWFGQQMGSLEWSMLREGAVGLPGGNGHLAIGSEGLGLEDSGVIVGTARGALHSPMVTLFMGRT